MIRGETHRQQSSLGVVSSYLRFLPTFLSKAEGGHHGDTYSPDHTPHRSTFCETTARGMAQMRAEAPCGCVRCSHSKAVNIFD